MEQCPLVAIAQSTETPKMRTPIATSSAPAAIGPYSQAIKHGDLLWCSGQIPLHPDGSHLVGSTAAEQAHQCLSNLSAVCSEAGTSLQ